jgi:hypothetical protein
MSADQRCTPHQFDCRSGSVFHLDADPDPDLTNHFVEVMRICFYWSTDPPGSRVSYYCGSIIFYLPMLLNFDLMLIRFRIQRLLSCVDPNRLFTLMWVRIRITHKI